VSRLAQTLNVYWEKTPESVLYTAVQTAVDNLDGVQLIDYTSTENACLSHLPGKWLAASKTSLHGGPKSEAPVE